GAWKTRRGGGTPGGAVCVPHTSSRHDVAYDVLEHLPASSAQQMAHAQGLSGRRVAKPIFLGGSNRTITVVLPATAMLDLDRVKEVVGVPGLRLATEEEMAGWFK